MKQHVGNRVGSGERILLGLLPYWDPLIPPLGISSLKSFIKKHGYRIHTFDANYDRRFKQKHTDYMSLIMKFIPEENRRHLYNVGHPVLQRHLMAYFNRGNPADYDELVRILVERTFFHPLSKDQISQLNGVVESFFGYLEHYLTDLLNRHRPTVLGLSVYGGTLASSLFAFRLSKQCYPGIKTVMGGGIFSGELEMSGADFKDFVHRVPYIDKIIIGEGEALLLKFLQDDLPADRKVFTRSHPGIEPGNIEELDVPDFDDLDLQYYPQLASSTSRSCPFQCSFCVETTYWGKYRKRSGGAVLNEMRNLYRRYAKGLFLMCDSLLNPVIDELSEACLAEDLSIYWGGYLRAGGKVLDADHTVLWRRGGFYRARLGLESGSQRILDAMGKRLTIEEIKGSVANLAQAGIKTTTYWVIGYPGETEEDFRATLDLITEMKDEIYEADCNAFWFFPSGQVQSQELARRHTPVELYPEDTDNSLMIRTWILDGEPSRRELFRRVNRFVEHCRRLGIPNPYSLYDLNRADERWKRLNRNAVPTLLEVTGARVSQDERKRVKKAAVAADKSSGLEEWSL